MEEIGVDIINAEMYDPEAAETTVWKRNIPPVSAIFHTINRENFYTVTLENELLRRAFVDGNAMTRLANQIINTLYNSDNYDEWLIFKNLFSAYNAAQLFYPVVITEPTNADTAKPLFSRYALQLLLSVCRAGNITRSVLCVTAGRKTWYCS